MKVTDYFEAAQDKTLISFEVLPPMKGGTMQSIFNTLDPLMEFKPPFIDVTYHREEFIYRKRESGYYEKQLFANALARLGFVLLSCTATVLMRCRT